MIIIIINPMRSSLGYARVFQDFFCPLAHPAFVHTYIHTYIHARPPPGKGLTVGPVRKNTSLALVIITRLFHHFATTLPSHHHIIYLGYGHVEQPCREKKIVMRFFGTCDFRVFRCGTGAAYDESRLVLQLRGDGNVFFLDGRRLEKVFDHD